MPEQTPIWRNEGVEPPESLKDNGWEPGMKPSAQHMNWLFNQLSRLAIESVVTVEDILTSVSTENALSANQGRVINNNLTNLKNEVTTHLDDFEIHLGGKAISINGQDLNTIYKTGFYCGYSLINAPGIRNVGYLEHLEYQQTGYALQKFYYIHATTKETYIRQKVAGAWTAWDMVITNGNIEYQAIKNSAVIYEKGIWTPVLKGTTTAGNPTYVAQQGEYIRQNNQIYVRGRVYISDKSNMAGNIEITGLPFITAGNYRVANIGLFTHVTFPTASRGLSGFIESNVMRPYFINTGTEFSRLTAADILNGFSLAFSAVYDIA